MKRKLMTLMALAMAAFVAQATTLYVAPGGTGDGSDWDHAADLATAAANADATELKLLAGDYPLTAQLSFASGRNVHIVGGYTGDGETRGSEKSILYRDPSVEQMRLIEATSATLDLQGLAFTNGFFVAVEYEKVYGVALKLTSSTVSMNDCAIRDNGSNPASADDIMGPGKFYGCVYVSGGTFAATNTVFANNYFGTYRYSSMVFGVGLSAAGAATITLEGCTFYRNRARVMYEDNEGMGLRVDASDLTMKHCTVEENYCRRYEDGGEYYEHNDAHGGGLRYSGGDGRICLVEDTVFKGNWLNDGSQSDGAVSVYAEGTCQPTFTRCVFTGNGKRNEADPVAGEAKTTDCGQVRINSSGRPALITNCAFVDTANGQGLIVEGEGATVSRCTFANAGTYGIALWGGTLNLSDSIVWGNASGAISKKSGTTFNTSYCDLQGTALSPSDISVDPLLSTDGFAHLTSAAGYYAGGGFTGGVWTITSGTSPAIDQGDPSLAVGDETQPNGLRANLGAYAGTEVASHSKLGSDPIVREDELKVFAYDVTPHIGSGTIRGTVASTGGGANPTVYAVWDTTDHGATSALGDWAHSVEIGTPERWELFSTLMSPVSGLTYCRLLATNEKGTALSDPAIEFTVAAKPTLADVSAGISRKFVTVRATLQATGGAATSLRARCWATATPEIVTTNWYNEGYSVSAGTVASITFSGLTIGTDYQISFDAVSDIGVTESLLAVTTLNETDPIVRYVTPEGAGAQTGVDWANAYDHMQTALDECYVAGDVIYVKEGEYEHYGYADGNNPSAMAIASAAGLSIRGGYAGAGAPGEKGSGHSVFKQPNESSWTLGARRHIRILDSTVAFDGIDFERGSLPSSSESSEDRYGQSISAKSSALAFTDCGFFSNGFVDHDDGKNTKHWGGAIALRTGTLAVTNCAFRGNLFTCTRSYNEGGSAYGGAIYASDAATTVSGTTFDSNGLRNVYYTLKGGAIYCEGAQGALAVDHCTFTTNFCRSSENYGNGRMKGGSIAVENLERFDLSDSTFIGGWANCIEESYVTYMTTGQGGAIDIINTPSTISRTSFYHMGYRDTTHAWDSGAVTLESGSLALKNVLFADTWGHALDTLGGTLTADSCSFVGATLYGFFQRAGTVSFRNCLFSGCGDGDFYYYGGTKATFDYCFTQTAKEGVGNKTGDPKLADLVYCHPKSRAGHYDGGWFSGGEWVTTDAETSPTIDVGDPDATDAAEAEAKPNGHRLNIGYDAGLDVASKSVCGDNPVVDPNVLNVFAYEATGVTKTSATMRGEVASVANAGKVTVTVYWGESDPGKTAEGWDHSATVGSYDAWEQFSYTLSGKVEGTYYYRFKIANDAGEAWTGPSQSFEVTVPPTGTLDGVTHVTRHTAKVHGMLTATGGADTTVKLVVSRGAEETEYSVNNGNPVAAGTSFAVDVAGLLTNTTYDLSVELTNKGGTTKVAGTLTTLSTNAIVRYVTPTGAGIADGLTWASAYSNMQEAVEACVYAGDVIYLKGGTYRECGYSESDDYSQCFIRNAQDLAIRGGYAGEGAPGAKGAEPTVFIRDTAAQPHPYRRLFRCKDSKLLFEDVSFTNGCLEVSPGCGHGIQLENCRTTLRDCRILKCGYSGGKGDCYGGAIYAQNGSLRLENSTLAQNNITRWADDSYCYGGGIYATGVDLSLTNCVLALNNVQNMYHSCYGGGIYATGGSLQVEDSRFCTNTVVMNYHDSSSDGRGGNLYVSGTPTVIRGCDFVGGYAAASFSKGGNITFDLGGKAATMDRCRMYAMAKGTEKADIQIGSLRLESGTLATTNCLVASIGRGNAIDVAGGTFSMDCCTVADAAEYGLAIAANVTPTMRNTIVWGNATGGVGGAYASNLAATYSDIQGVTPDAENHILSADPKFRGEVKGKGQQWNVSSSSATEASGAATIGAATFLSLQSSGYELQSSSPCVNAGDATGIVANATDLAGGPRVRSGGLDLGCYEAICRGFLLLVK